MAGLGLCGTLSLWVLSQILAKQAPPISTPPSEQHMTLESPMLILIEVVSDLKLGVSNTTSLNQLGCLVMDKSVIIIIASRNTTNL